MKHCQRDHLVHHPTSSPPPICSMRLHVALLAVMALACCLTEQGQAAIEQPPTPGDLDPAFGSMGSVVRDLGDDVDRAFALAVQPDGKPVVVGVSDGKPVLVRF